MVVSSTCRKSSERVPAKHSVHSSGPTVPLAYPGRHSEQASFILIRGAVELFLGVQPMAHPSHDVLLWLLLGMYCPSGQRSHTVPFTKNPASQMMEARTCITSCNSSMDSMPHTQAVGEAMLLRRRQLPEGRL